MNEQIVEIPDVLSNINTFEEFLNAIPYEKQVAGTRLIFNMEKVSFINPYGMLMLMLMGRYLHQRVKIPAYLVNLHKELYRYLERMNFFRHAEDWFIYSKIMEEYQPYSRSERSLKLIEIMPITLNNGIKDVYDVVGEFRQRANSILEFWLHRVDVDKFVTVISEVCQNIFMHSGDIGHVALQTYKHWGENIVNLAVCDMGIGVKASLQHQYPNESFDTTSDYIWHALYEMPTSGERHHYGLSKVRDIVQEWGGFLFIRSFDGSLLVSPKHPSGEPNDNCKSFPGTQIMIWLSSNVTISFLVH